MRIKEMAKAEMTFWDSLKTTPIWVWILLALLVVVGIVASR